MRKRNITHVADTIFWWVMYTLPLIYGLVYAIGVANSMVIEFSTYFEAYSSDYSFANEVFVTYINELASSFSCGTEYFISLYASDMIGCPVYNGLYEAISFLGFTLNGSYYEVNVPMGILTWFAIMNIIHLFIDFILFIPRLCHKWMGKATQED